MLQRGFFKIKPIYYRGYKKLLDYVQKTYLHFMETRFDNKRKFNKTNQRKGEK